MTSSGQSLEQRPLRTEKDTDFRQSGMFSNILYIPYANAQATAMQIHLTWDLGLILSMKKGDQFKSHYFLQFH